ncbi:SDR family NAD(P)-dependent oxidoreductase [Streptomyces avicenniae]|uniref:SDR family NAD(P)-dependent oxidoreductase n=1 Tax=Streptomyces avicenniae TaxID=500153 RepID=UPI00069B3146|nr:SDR family NAD(P)-dependent oxidoreductase [Streptomyces avicenniae]
MDATQDGTRTAGTLRGAVVAVAGAGGPAGQAALRALAAAGATVAGADADAVRLAEAVAAAREARPGATVTGATVDLLDPDATRDWAARTEREHGRVDGLVHLVGGWRGSRTFAATDLADWDLLHGLLIRTVQHTSLAFEAPLARSGDGRFVLVSAAGASRPTAGNAAYAAAKAAAEAWTLALADSFRKAAPPDGPPPAAATVLVVKALLTDAQRAEHPERAFPGHTHVSDLADAIAAQWSQPTADVNGTRQWLTPRP